MAGRYETYDRKLRRSIRVKRFERVLLEMALGAVVGAVTGAIGGPPGIYAGAIIGAFIGFLAGLVAVQEEARRALRERKLDEIGLPVPGRRPTWY